LRLGSNRYLEGGRRGFEKLGRILWSNVGDEISKTIHFQHHASQGPLVHRLGTRRAKTDVVGDLFPEAAGFDSLGKKSRDWRKNIAGMEGIAAWLQKIMLGGDVADRTPLFSIVDQRQNAVVGSHKHVALAGQDDRPPRGAHAGIDDHHVHGAGREVRVGLRNGQRTIQNVEGLHSVADVDDLRLGGDFQDDPLHGADEMIVEYEISGESDDRVAFQSVTSLSRRFSGTPTQYRTRHEDESRSQHLAIST